MLKLEDETCYPLNRCVVCDFPNLNVVLDLGQQPLANSFTDFPSIQNEYPLKLMFCEKCTHLQLSHCVSRDLIFKDYIYVSGTSETLKQDFRNFAKFVTQRHGIGRVLDIACNDGSQLDAFKELGWETFGIDPAENLLEFSSKNHNIICDFLNWEHTKLGNFDVVIAQNVLAHTDKPLDFLRICSKLSENVYVQTSQANMIFEGQFDTIYHEHISFFSQESMKVLAEKAGLKVSQVSKREIHGVSYLFHLVAANLDFEPSDLVSIDTIEEFKRKVESTLDFIRTEIELARKNNMLVIGYGAAAKGMTVLNTIGLKLDFIIDDSSLKQNKYSPGLGIKVVPITELSEIAHGKEILLIPLAWNFADEISRRVKGAYQGRVKTIKYFPRTEVL